MAKTIGQINEKIASGDVVVVTAEEIIDIVEADGPEKAAEQMPLTQGDFLSHSCNSILAGLPHRFRIGNDGTNTGRSQRSRL